MGVVEEWSGDDTRFNPFAAGQSMWWRKYACCYVEMEKLEGLRSFCSGAGESSKELVDSYLLAMRVVPSAVVVVTTSDGSLKRGVTCSSFTSVSLHPPIISFTMQQHSRMHKLLLSTQRFAANILSEQQANYSVHFSRPHPENSDVCQFDSIPHFSSGPTGIPILTGCSSVLQCSTHDVHTIGDHHVWYGKVHHASQTDTPPLLYYDRSYRSIGDETFIRAFETATLGYEEWTHEAHLRMAWNYLTLHGREKATPIIREGIKNYIDQNYGKVKNIYNETITLFFIHMLHSAIEQCNGSCRTFEEFLEACPHLSDPQLLSRHYSLSRVHSSEARNSWLEPDLKPLP